MSRPITTNYGSPFPIGSSRPTYPGAQAKRLPPSVQAGLGFSDKDDTFDFANYKIQPEPELAVDALTSKSNSQSEMREERPITVADLQAVGDVRVRQSTSSAASVRMCLGLAGHAVRSGALQRGLLPWAGRGGWYLGPRRP
jgi:hypothetical protein